MTHQQQLLAASTNQLVLADADTLLREGKVQEAKMLLAKNFGPAAALSAFANLVDNLLNPPNEGYW